MSAALCFRLVIATFNLDEGSIPLGLTFSSTERAGYIRSFPLSKRLFRIAPIARSSWYASNEMRNAVTTLQQNLRARLLMPITCVNYVFIYRV